MGVGGLGRRVHQGVDVLLNLPHDLVIDLTDVIQGDGLGRGNDNVSFSDSDKSLYNIVTM